MTKKILIGLLLSLSLISVSQVLAAEVSNQSGVQRAVTAVQESIEDLVTAKDQNNVNDTTFRVEAFKKVVSLSISEAKEIKIKLLSAEMGGNKDLTAWQDKMAAALDRALNYYDEESQKLEQMTNFDLVTIKNLASDFKNWRDENYLPLTDQINNFILIQEEQKAINVAEKRAQKIGNDIKNLPSIKNFDPAARLQKAKKSIALSKEINREAYEMFLNQYVFPIASSSASTTIASSTGPSPILTPLTLTPENAPAGTSSPTAVSSSTASNASSTEAESFQPSIKDLIKASLDKVKEAYQIFIEMSNSVRKLLR